MRAVRNNGPIKIKGKRMEKNLMNNRNVEAVVRETKRRTLSLIHEMEYKTEEVRMKGILENYDPSDCEQVVPEKVKTAYECFVKSGKRYKIIWMIGIECSFN